MCEYDSILSVKKKKKKKKKKKEKKRKLFIQWNLDEVSTLRCEKRLTLKQESD